MTRYQWAIFTASIIAFHDAQAGCLIRGRFVAGDPAAPAGRIVSRSCGWLSFGLPKGGARVLGGSSSLYDATLRKELLDPGYRDLAVAVSPGGDRVAFVETDGRRPESTRRVLSYAWRDGSLAKLRGMGFDPEVHQRRYLPWAWAARRVTPAGGRADDGCHGHDLVWVDDRTIGFCRASFETWPDTAYEAIELPGR